VRGSLRSGVLCLALALGLVAAGATSATATSVEFETSLGPVSCGPSFPEEGLWAQLQESAGGPRVKIDVLGASTLECQTSTLGAVEISGAHFPWRLTVNEQSRQARLKGAGGLVLEARFLALASARCVYQAGKAQGTLSGDTPAVLSLAIRRVKLERKLSNLLCPVLEPVAITIPLP
jgi:hypothetical protein